MRDRITIARLGEDRLHEIFHVKRIEGLSVEHALKVFVESVDREIDVPLRNKIFSQPNHLVENRAPIRAVESSCRKSYCATPNRWRAHGCSKSNMSCRS